MSAIERPGSIPPPRIIHRDEQANADAVKACEEALAAAKNPGEGITGAAILLFRPDGTFMMWWSEGGNVGARLGALERMKFEVLTELHRHEQDDNGSR